MKKILVFFLVSFTSNVFSENTILAIVNNSPMTLNSVQADLEVTNLKEEKIIIINNHIDNILQIQKAIELNLTPTKKDLENTLNDIAQSNNLSLKELINFEDFALIESEIAEKLLILNLQRFITKDLKVSEEEVINKCSNDNLIKDQKQIKIAQIIISEIDSPTSDIKKITY